MTLADAIRRLRREIDQPALVDAPDGPVATDADIWSSYASRYSDEDLAQRIESGVFWVIARIAASSVTNLFRTVRPGILDDEENFIRFVDESVVVTENAYPVTRQATRARLELDGSGRRPTELSPVYVFEDMEFDVRPVDLDATAMVVSLPVSDASGHAIEKVDDEIAYIAVMRAAMLADLSLPTYEMALEHSTRHGRAATAFLSGQQLNQSSTPYQRHISQINDVR